LKLAEKEQQKALKLAEKEQQKALKLAEKEQQKAHAQTLLQEKLHLKNQRILEKQAQKEQKKRVTEQLIEQKKKLKKIQLENQTLAAIGSLFKKSKQVKATVIVRKGKSPFRPTKNAHLAVRRKNR